MASDQPIRLPHVPLDLAWQPPPERWDLADGILTVKAGARTDLFIDPSGGPAVRTAPRLLGQSVGDFLLSARLTVDFAARFDAGALLLYASDDSWAKLCLEYSPRNEPTVVSVVTRGLSDDCNSCPVGGNPTWLRIARLGGAFAFHASIDGETWNLIRHFTLGQSGDIAVGFLAQSPEGNGCAATFGTIRHRRELLGDLRNGE